MEAHFACPICKGPLEDTGEKYLCKRCNMRFLYGHASVSVPSSIDESEPAEPRTPFVRSSDSETYHLPGCKYAKRIEGPIALTEEESQGLRPCGCVKRNR